MKLHTIYRGLVVTAVLLTVAGCASKQDRELFREINARSPELRVLQQTETAVFDQGGDNETLVIATYLPNQSGSAGEAFILAVHPVDGLGSPAFTLEGLPPKSLRRVDRRELPADLAASIPRWFTVYRARFAPAKRKRFELAIRSKDGKIRRLSFAKGPKYLSPKTGSKDSAR